MRLSRAEFLAMNNPARRLLQRAVELPLLRRMGLQVENRDVLEIGCGSGYAAALLSRLGPRRYVGVDLMPEQIALARARRLPDAEFRIGDATDLIDFPDASQDVVIIFGVLHHIPAWRRSVDEIGRVLRPGGQLYVEEPGHRFIELTEPFVRLGHPVPRLRLRDLEEYLAEQRLPIAARRYLFGFGLYRADKVTFKINGAQRQMLSGHEGV
jgi:SAM-dependent methyltransferase